MKLLDRYFLRQILPVMVLTLMVAATLLMLDKLLTVLNLTIGAGVSALIAIQMMLARVPEYLRLVLPLGLFLGVLFTFRTLSMNSEFHVMQSSGVGLLRMVRSAIALSIVGLGLSFGLVGYGEPLARYLYNLLYFNVTNGVIQSGIGEGIFVKIPGGWTIRVEQSESAGRKLFGVFLVRYHEDGRIETYTAKQGELKNINQKLVLMLVEGERKEWSIDKSEVKVASFDEGSDSFNLSELLKFRDRGGDEVELTLGELTRAYLAGLKGGWDSGTLPLPEGVPESTRQVRFSALAAEFHERIAYAFSILLMPFFAPPLGISSPRSSRFAGPAVGLIGIFAYQKILEAIGKAAAAGNIPAAPAIWTSFVIFSVLIVVLFWRTSRSTGMTPFNTFENAMADFAQAVSLRLAARRAAKPA